MDLGHFLFNLLNYFNFAFFYYRHPVRLGEVFIRIQLCKKLEFGGRGNYALCHPYSFKKKIVKFIDTFCNK